MRRSLEATTVALYSGGFEGAWVIAGREVAAGREVRLANGAAGSANVWWERRGVAARREKRVGRKKMSG